MHRVVGDLPQLQRDMIYRLHDTNDDLEGRTVLVIDDDARNIFALSSVLERSGMKVLTASNGRDALRLVDETPDLAIILTDIMMPGMDGYEVIETIRQRPDLRRLPIIALTAKAMKGDREKCLEAGASDYLAKPVDTDQLVAALRVWLHR
jgi:CheY-like chemotaxis protein